jgi:hypothetical protein
VVAPYVSATESGSSVDGLGSPIDNGPLEPHLGIDVKWTPKADNALEESGRQVFVKMSYARQR